MFNLVENLKVVEAIPPQVGAAAVITGDYLSVKNYHRVFCVVHYASADAAAETFAIHRATAVAGTDDAVLVTAQRIWRNLNTATNDTLVEEAAAVNYATDAVASNKIVVFEVDPAKLGETAGGVPFDCITIVTTAIAAGNYISAVYYCVPRIEGRVSTAPSGVTD
jgi:hypothetical protein